MSKFNEIMSSPKVKLIIIILMFIIMAILCAIK